ncbi:hypothetical protein Droror1_Dr00012091 [Drosera rotundifolia]
METTGAAAGVLGHQNQPPQKTGGERLNAEIQSELNLESVRTRAISLYKAISRIIEEVDGLARSNSCPKWHDVLGQFSMVNLELFNIVEEIKKVSKSFVVCPKNVNAEKATILPVMLSSKLLLELEIEDNSKREQLLHGMQDLPIPAQIDMLKSRIDAIAAACESAEKVLADTRKAYGLDTRQRLTTLPTLDKAQAAKIQEQENLLRAAVNHGEGLRLPADQRQIMSELPLHLADVLAVRDPVEPSGIYLKNTPPLSSVHAGNQGTSLQTAGPQLTGRSLPSPSAGTSAASFDNTTSPLPHVNSPRSGTNMMNAPSPQQQMQQPQLMQQQLRQKMMQLPPHQQQLLTQQQLRQSAMQALGTLQGQYQIQFSQPLSTQQFQGRQLPTGHLQHGIGQNQLTQGNQLNRHMGQLSGQANSALFNTSQTVPNAPLIPNMSAAMASQSLLPRMQFALSGGNAQRAHSSQILNDQMFNLGTSNTGSLIPMQQQQQHGSQGAFGAMSQNPQNLQANMVAALQNAQHHPNFQQQRPQNQQ